MELGIWLIIGILATWRLTHDITSDMELDGPFALWRLLRKVARQEWVPEFFKDGIDCPFCVSFVVGHFVAILLPIYGAMGWWHTVGAYAAVSWALSGAVTLYIRRMKTIYGVDAREV